MTENETATIVVDACYQIHTRLGPGLLESVYETLLEYELKKRGLQVRRQVGIPFVYDAIKFDEGFRADLIVENKVILTAGIHDRVGVVGSVSRRAQFAAEDRFVDEQTTPVANTLRG